MPLLAEEALAYAECAVEQELEAGDHVVFVCLVEGGRPPDPDSVPILYYRRSYGSVWTAAS